VENTVLEVWCFHSGYLLFFY